MKKTILAVVFLLCVKASIAGLEIDSTCITFDERVKASERITESGTLSQKIMKLDSIVEMQDSIISVKDSVIKAQEKVINSIPPKPDKGAKAAEWINYVIAILSFLVVWLISKIKYLQTVQNPIIQRLVSETSTFIKRIQVICGAISVLIPVVMMLGVFGDYGISILNNIEVALLAIVGFTMFTTKKPELQD